MHNYTEKQQPRCPYCGAVVETFYNNFAYHAGLNVDGDDTITDCSQCGREFKVVYRQVMIEYYETFPTNK